MREVTPPSQDRDGGALVMASLFGGFLFLVKLYADGGYQGKEFQSGAAFAASSETTCSNCWSRVPSAPQ